jgi:hypothetical protein
MLEQFRASGGLETLKSVASAIEEQRRLFVQALDRGEFEALRRAAEALK